MWNVSEFLTLFQTSRKALAISAAAPLFLSLQTGCSFDGELFVDGSDSSSSSSSSSSTTSLSTPTFSLTATDYNQVQVTITGLPQNATGVIIQRSSDAGSTWPTTLYSGSNPGTYTDTSVVLNNAYFYRVKAITSAGTGDASTPQSITPRVNAVSAIELVDTPFESLVTGTSGTGYTDLRRAAFWYASTDFVATQQDQISFEFQVVATNTSASAQDVWLHRASGTDLIGMNIPAGADRDLYYINVDPSNMSNWSGEVFVQVTETATAYDFVIHAARLVVYVPQAVRARMYYPLTSGNNYDQLVAYGDGARWGVTAASASVYFASASSLPTAFSSAWALTGFQRKDSDTVASYVGTNPWQFEATAGNCNGANTVVNVSLRSISPSSYNFSGTAVVTTTTSGTAPVELVRVNYPTNQAGFTDLKSYAPSVHMDSGTSCLYSARMSVLLENIVRGVSVFRTATRFNSPTGDFHQFWENSQSIPDATAISNPSYDLQSFAQGNSNFTWEYIHGVTSNFTVSGNLNSTALQHGSGAWPSLISMQNVAGMNGFAFFYTDFENPTASALAATLLGQQVLVHFGQ